MRRYGAVVALSVMLAACSGQSAGSKPTGALPATPFTPSPTPSPTPKPVPKTAQAVIQALAKINKHVTLTVTYTARTDPNNLLGRPGGYVSKSAFSDDRVRRVDAVGSGKGGIDHGGGVEYFSTPNQALARARYVAGFNGTIAGGEYDYVDGGVVLRVSDNVLPAAARRYERQLARIMHHPATAPR